MSYFSPVGGQNSSNALLVLVGVVGMEVKGSHSRCCPASRLDDLIVRFGLIPFGSLLGVYRVHYRTGRQITCTLLGDLAVTTICKSCD